MIVSFLDFYDENDRHVLVVVDKIGPGETDEDYTARTMTQGSPEYEQAQHEIVTRRPDLTVFFQVQDRSVEGTER